MKKALPILTLLLCVATIATAQSKEVEEQLAVIAGQWKLNDAGQLEYTRIVEVTGASAEDLYNRAINYLHLAYNNSSQTIKQQDKSQGRILAKGIFADLFTQFMGASATFNSDHAIQVDTKEGKARIIVTIDQFTLNAAQWNKTYGAAQMYPVSDKSPGGTNKNASAKAFISAHERVQQLLAGIESAVKSGGTQAAGSDW